MTAKLIIDCPRAQSDMTPCAARDGKTACLEDGTCVGCGENVAELLKELVLKYAYLRATLGQTQGE